MLPEAKVADDVCTSPAETVLLLTYTNALNVEPLKLLYEISNELNPPLGAIVTSTLSGIISS